MPTIDDLDKLAAEKWKPIEFYPGYKISNLGRVKSYCHKSGILKKFKILKLCKTSNGKYFGVSLIDEYGQNKYKMVHRLVLTAFKGHPKDGNICCHNDGNGLNNELSNLRWDTHKANHFDKWRHGTMPVGENCNAAKYSNKDIEVIQHLLKRGCRNVDIAKLFGMDRTTIERIKNGKSRIHA